MNKQNKILNSGQISFLQEMIERGNANVPATLEMLTGREVEKHTVKTEVVAGLSMRQILTKMDMESDSVASVVSDAQGDFKSTLLFLQSMKDFEALGQVMGHALTGTDRSRPHQSARHLQPDWTYAQKHQILDKEKLQAQMLDTIGEIGNILFGSYLATIQNECKLTTFQSVPTTKLANNPLSLLMQVIPWNRARDTVFFINRIDCVIRQRPMKAWVLVIPHESGLQSLIEHIDGLNALKARRTQWPPSGATTSLSGKQSKPYTGHLISQRFAK